MDNETKPLIALVADTTSKPRHRLHTTQEKYLDAVSAGAHAMAVILPARIDWPGAAFTDPADVESVLDRIDGLFLTGATSNVDPSHYGATLRNPESPADNARDQATLALIRAAVARGLPVLGVCRGFQEINVALGGTLHQAVHDVPGLNDHRERDDHTVDQQYGPSHPVTLAEGSLLRRLAGRASIEVNSLHGQGVERLAPGLVVEARAPDGLVEAFRGTSLGFLHAVQWHPEWKFRDNPVSVALFGAFGRACRAWAAGVRLAAQAA